VLLSRLRHRYVVPPEFGNTYRREIGDIFWDLNPHTSSPPPSYHMEDL
jgi:hypothetical protein